MPTTEAVPLDSIAAADVTPYLKARATRAPQRKLNKHASAPLSGRAALSTHGDKTHPGEPERITLGSKELN